jgi:hypothetical protein
MCVSLYALSVSESSLILAVPNVRFVQTLVKRVRNNLLDLGPAGWEAIQPKPRGFVIANLQANQRSLKTPFLYRLGVLSLRHDALISIRWGREGQDRFAVCTVGLRSLIPPCR